MKDNSEYDQIEAGQWVSWLKKGVDLACCSCGFCHRIKWRIKNVNGRDELQLNFTVNGPATGGLRKAMRAAAKK